MIINGKKLKGIRTKEKTNGPGSERWILHLYVAGHTPKAVTAIKNIKLICEEQLKGKYQIEVIDLWKKPKRAHEDQILALPTLVRRLPLPVRNIIGDLSDTKKVLSSLGILQSGTLKIPTVLS